MSTFTDDWNDHAPRATVTVLENTRSAKVTYSNDTGAKFRVMVHQKPNPIGFGAQLPGDKPRKR